MSEPTNPPPDVAALVERLERAVEVYSPMSVPVAGAELLALCAAWRAAMFALETVEALGDRAPLYFEARRLDAQRTARILAEKHHA